MYFTKLCESQNLHFYINFSFSYHFLLIVSILAAAQAVSLQDKVLSPSQTSSTMALGSDVASTLDDAVCEVAEAVSGLVGDLKDDVAKFNEDRVDGPPSGPKTDDDDCPLMDWLDGCTWDGCTKGDE